MNSRSRTGMALSVPGAVLLSLILAAHTVAAASTLSTVRSLTDGERRVSDPVSLDSHAPRSHERIPALMYHRIACAPDGTRGPHRWVCPERFDATLALLKESGWDTMTARRVSWRLKHGLTFPDKTFVIVIDDGKWDGYDNAFPILEKYDFVAVFGVVVGRVSVKDISMTWEELIELESNGHEIANHSMSHANLGSPTARLWREIEKSSRILAEKLGHRPKTFVYPYGSWSSAAVEQVRQSGFRLAYTTAKGCVLSWPDRLLEERIRINRSDSPEEVLAKVAPCA